MKQIKNMTPEEQREYHRNATRAWRARVLADPERTAKYLERANEAQKRYMARIKKRKKKGIACLTKRTVKKWMLANAWEYEDLQTGEICATALAEAAAEKFGQNDVGGPLDDEQHWIWGIAVDVAKECEK